MSKPIIGYKNCEYCSQSMAIHKYYEQKRFCSAKCRSKVVTMPPRPDRTGAVPWNKGIKWTELSKARQGSGNPNWKGDNIGYSQVHKWARERLEKPSECQSCGQERYLHMSNISYEYKRDLDDWEYLCVPCHSRKDRDNGQWGQATRKFGLH